MQDIEIINVSETTKSNLLITLREAKKEFDQGFAAPIYDWDEHDLAYLIHLVKKDMKNNISTE